MRWLLAVMVAGAAVCEVSSVQAGRPHSGFLVAFSIALWFFVIFIVRRSR